MRLMETAEDEDRRKWYTEDMRLMETGEDEDKDAEVVALVVI
jgi:hypothetical protein